MGSYTVNLATHPIINVFYRGFSQEREGEVEGLGVKGEAWLP